MSYSRNILVTGVVISYYDGAIYISSESVRIKNSVKKTLNELYSDNVSGNISWNPLDIIETFGNLYLIFLGLIDGQALENDYGFKSLDNKLSRPEKLALRELKKEVHNLNAGYLKAILSHEFLIRDLYQLYRLLVNKNKDRANFYKLVKKKDYIVPVGRRKRDVYHRPPEYYMINNY